MRTVALIGAELYPIPPLRGGGAELFIDQVAAHLTSWRPVVIGPTDPDLPLQESKGRVDYIRVGLTGWRRWLYRRHGRQFPYYDRRVAAVIARVKPDLLHVHNRPLLALYLLQRLPNKIPIILHMHNLYHSLGKRERPPPGTPIPAAGFVACSRFVLEAEWDRLGLGAALHRVVYNGVDPEAFSSIRVPEGAQWEIREKHGLASAPTVLFVGKLRESKGVHILVAAMEQVWRAIPEAVLVLVGGTEYGLGRTARETRFFKELRKQLHTASGRVVLTGFIPPPQMPQAYLLGDVFVGPSQIEEGLGLVFLEASAAGLPIIASRVGGIPEIVRDGVNGLLLDKKDDSQELAEKIVHLLRDRELRHRLGGRGREWVLASFSWQKIAQALEQVYEEVRNVGQARPAL